MTNNNACIALTNNNNYYAIIHYVMPNFHDMSIIMFKGELTKKFLFLFSLDQVSLISLLKYFPPKMSLT